MKPRGTLKQCFAFLIINFTKVTFTKLQIDNNNNNNNTPAKVVPGEKIANFSRIFKTESSTFLKSLFYLISFGLGFYDNSHNYFPYFDLRMNIDIGSCTLVTPLATQFFEYLNNQKTYGP